IKDFITIGRGKAEIFEVVVAENSRAAGKELSQLNIKKGVVVAIERNSDIILPTGDAILEAGDLVTVFAKMKEAEKISSLFAP
ncbi:MAG: TrkA C-terminal domain-containing protein, partial [Candidatus Methanospirareceae archaeon]